MKLVKVDSYDNVEVYRTSNNVIEFFHSDKIKTTNHFALEFLEDGIMMKPYDKTSKTIIDLVLWFEPEIKTSSEFFSTYYESETKVY